MALDNDNIRGDVSPDELSLESILAEYKGSAFIDGDKKTPAHILNEKTEKIIMEVTGENTAGTLFSTVTDYDSALSGEDYEAAPESADKPSDNTEFEIKANPGGDKGGQPVAEVTDNDILFFENFRYSQREVPQDVADEVEKAVAKETGFEEETKEAVKRSFRIFRRNRDDEETEADGELFEEPEEEEVFEEPELKDAAKRFAVMCNSTSLRFIAALFVTATMVIATFAFEAGLTFPFGIGTSRVLVTGILLIMQLIVMILCVDIIVRGALKLAGGRPNAETLILFSCAFSLISGAFSIVVAESNIGLPYSVVSASSLTFALLGERYYLRALTETLKTAAISSEPYGMVAEFRKDINKTVLKKAYKRTDSFYNNLMHPDISETAHRYAAPVLLACALVLSIFTVIARDRGQYLLHILSALLAASASFSSVIAFSIPFASIAKSARRSGAAIAGWGGADDIWHTDGASITDDDLFPVGTLSLSGAQVFSGVSDEKVVRYTSSLIIASGSGLARIFAELLAKSGMSLIRVDDFACYEGGVGALIRGERVMVGSAAFMNLLGIRVPEEVNLKNAVFTSVNDKLISVFTVDYVPVNSVQSGLVTILKWRVKLFFAVRDFNITPLMLEQKFKVAVDDIEYIPAQDSYSISDTSSPGTGRVAAVLTREGLGPLGEAVTGGRLLKSAATVSTVLSLVSSFAGVLLVFFMCWMGAFTAARPGNLLVFMLSTLAAVFVACGYVKCRK